MFKPTKKHLQFRDLLFSGHSDAQIEKELNLEHEDLVQMFEEDGFGQWLYEFLQKAKWKYVVRIELNLFKRAIEQKAGAQMIELALRVTDVYTPTSKKINEELGKIKQKEIDELKKKAKEVRDKRKGLRVVEGGAK